ncbi:MAG: hypothetical protein ACWGMZ_01980 [Thermoguttaceae bacterium]
MRYFTSFCRASLIPLLIFAANVSYGASRFAKGAQKSAPEGFGAWAFAYFVVALPIILGLIAVCKSSSRRDSAKPLSFERVKKTLLDD